MRLGVLRMYRRSVFVLTTLLSIVLWAACPTHGEQLTRQVVAPEGFGLVRAKVIASARTPTGPFLLVHATGSDMYLVKFRTKAILSQPDKDSLPLRKGDNFDVYLSTEAIAQLQNDSTANFIDQSRHVLRPGQYYLLPIRYQADDAIFVSSSLPGSAKNIPHFHL